MKIISVRNIDNFVDTVKPKPSKQRTKIVKSILSDVQKRGDLAIRYYEKKFGTPSLGTLRVSKKEIKNAYSQVTKEEVTAIKIAKTRLTKTESTLKNQLKSIVINTDGTKLRKFFELEDYISIF